jgi:hypothetical protein
MIIKYTILILIIIGVILIIIDCFYQMVMSYVISKSQNTCQNTNQNTNNMEKTKIIYKYIPRTFEDEQNNQPYPSDIFKKMFTGQSPWIASVQDMNKKKIEQINKYFISQE